MPEPESLIFIVDDDASVRAAICNLLESVGLCSEVFASTEDFLNSSRPEVPSCLVLDVKLPGMGGLEFQEVLAGSNIQIPLSSLPLTAIFRWCRRAMKAGAVEFLTKPFQKKDLLAAIQQSLELDRARRKEQTASELITLRLSSSENAK